MFAYARALRARSSAQRSGVFGATILVIAVAACLLAPQAAFADSAEGSASAASPLGPGVSDDLAEIEVTDEPLGAVVHASDEDAAERFVKTVCFKDETDETIVLPSFADLSSVELWYGEDEDSRVAAYVSGSQEGPFAQGPVDAGALPQDSLGGHVVYVKGSAQGEARPVRVVRSANVGAMFLTSSDPVNQGRAFIEASPDHSARTTGQMLMADASGAVRYDGDLTQIKGRGNATWETDKRPYQIKLDKKTALLGGDKSNKAKTWVLLANAYDETVGLRNYIALRTAFALGLSSTPECEFLDLYYDGEYRGLYLLCEKVQVNSGRVDIDEIENASNDDADLEDHATKRSVNKYGYEFQYVEGVVLDPASSGDDTGGYLLETSADRYNEERSWFMSSIGAIVVKSPEDASLQQMTYVSERFQEMLDVLALPDGDAASVIDLDSLARTHAVNEFSKNFDYLLYSTYFHLPKGSSVFYAGPVWDFDLAFGVYPFRFDGAEYIDPKGYASQSRNFFKTNKAAVAAVKAAFTGNSLAVMRNWLNTVSEDDDATIYGAWKQISTAAMLDSRIWSSPLYSGMAYVMFNDGASAVDYLARWIGDRLDWLSQAVAAAQTFESVDYSGIGEEAARSATQGGEGVVRLWGKIALDTMEAIIDRGQFQTDTVAILVTSENFPDALTAAGVAGMANAPIIMTAKDQLSAQAQSQLEKLRPQTIVVCGGEEALTPAVASAAANAAGGANVERLWGMIASDTAVAIFERGPEVTGGSWARTAFVCTSSGYWDALAASPISYATGMPIFLVDEDGSTLSDATMQVLKENIDAVYIVGGEAAVTPDAVRQLKGAGITVAGRLWGADAVETSCSVAGFGLSKGMSASNVGVATNNGYWDALAAAPFCGRMNAVLVLAGGPGDASIAEFLANRADIVNNAFVFGGTAAVSGKTYDAVASAIGAFGR